MPARTRASSRSEEFVASLQRSLSESQRWLDAFERIVDIRPLRGFGYSKCNRKCRRHVRMMTAHILISTAHLERLWFVLFACHIAGMFRSRSCDLSNNAESRNIVSNLSRNAIFAPNLRSGIF